MNKGKVLIAIILGCAVFFLTVYTIWTERQKSQDRIDEINQTLQKHINGPEKRQLKKTSMDQRHITVYVKVDKYGNMTPQGIAY